jgi:ribulose-5-phosphate 4-epimerase/fuculose-1-phosphate aldolase
MPRLIIVVLIDGLQPDHDIRRAPATYHRILRNIADQKVTIHCTVTGQMMKRPGYLKEFLEFWTPRPEIRKVWFSLFTPQVGDRLPEMLQPHERAQAIADMLALRTEFPKLDMPDGMIRQFATPPRNPQECVFALTTQTLSADLNTKIVPCQFGGEPDCSSCGCIASMGLAAVAAYILVGIIPVVAIFKASLKIGQARAKWAAPPSPVEQRLRVLPSDKNESPRVRKNMIVASHVELTRLRQLTARIGANPLLTQASTGNSSIKLDGVLWIKASGKWMADAMEQDIFIPLDLAKVLRDCLDQGVDPAGRFPGASIETAMHAVLLPHRVVLHVHSVNTIAWAVRKDAAIQLQDRLNGLPWQWIPYVASGLPLAHAIEDALFARPDTDVFVLGNHGVVIGGEDCYAVEGLLFELERRLAICPRLAHPADYAALEALCQGSSWDLPDDDQVHVLGTDAISRAILSGGLLYPCQAIFSNSSSPDLFKPIPYPHPGDESLREYDDRPFLILEGRGVLVSRTITPAERAMIGGLAQIVQRVNATTPLRYLSQAEVATARNMTGGRYRELANERPGRGLRMPALSDRGAGNSTPRKFA